MKTKSILFLCGASASRQANLMLAAVLIALPGSQSAQAASATWAATTNGTWATLGNWASGTVSVPGSALGETATFNTTPSGAGGRLISLGAGVTIRNITFTAAAVGAYTIGSGAVGSQTLTLEPLSAVTVAGTAAAPDDMTVTVATSNEVAGKLFLRLKAVK